MRYKLSKEALENAKLNIQEMKERKIILDSLPFKLNIEPTQRCNLNCVTCWEKRRRRKEDIDIKLYEKIEKELFPYMCEVNFYLVGEPLLAKNFLQLIERVEPYSFLPKIFTNGLIYSQKIYQRLIELGFFVNISTDAVSKKLFEKIRVGANFDVFKNNIRKIVDLSSEIKDRRFHIRLVMTAGSYNIQEAPSIIEFAHGLGIKDVMINDCDMGPPHFWNLMNAKDKVKEYLGKAMTLADKYKIRFSFPKYTGDERILKKNHNWDDFSLPIDKYAPMFIEEYNPVNGDCPYPWIETAIRVNGRVVACCQKLIKMGNLNTHSFMEIWNNNTYQKLRKKPQYYNCQGYCLLTRNSIWKGNLPR